MALTFIPLHPLFAAEVSPIDLRTTRDPATLAVLRGGMDRYGVLVFRAQPFSDSEQIDFATAFDGTLHARTSTAVLTKNRFGNEALSDISNVGADGRILPPDDRRRVSSLANRLWHTDASFVDPPGRYSMLSARVIPPVPADTEFPRTLAKLELVGRVCGTLHWLTRPAYREARRVPRVRITMGAGSPRG